MLTGIAFVAPLHYICSETEKIPLKNKQFLTMELGTVFSNKRNIILVIIAVLIVLFNMECSCGSKNGKEGKKKEKKEALLYEKYTYLVNGHAPAAAEECRIYKYSSTSQEMIAMAGGEAGYGGFSIDSKGAFVTFVLGGKYRTLTFTMGHNSKCSDETGVVTVRADGKKILDEKVSGYEPPRTYSLDISGVQELTFKVEDGDIYVMVADAILWKKGEKPVDVRTPIDLPAAPVELVRELPPYYMNSRMSTINEDASSPIRLNGREYLYGLRGNTTRASTGNAYFSLHGHFSRLSFIAGCHDDLTGQPGSAWVTVKADGKTIEEIEVKEGAIARQVVLDIEGCEVLSFHTERSQGESYAEISQITVYPNGEDTEARNGLAPPDPRLKDLPDACRLISSIPPFHVAGKAEKQIYDGSSEHITFSMGGYRYSEGIILSQSAPLLDDSLSSGTTFDLGNEFDYISFTAGYVDKEWNMNDDRLMIFADGELIFSTPLTAAYPNQRYVVPVSKCRSLRFANKGCNRKSAAAFGIGDIVAYRGKPVENSLFLHPAPECPEEASLIGLGRPYIHHVSPNAGEQDDIIRDGSTKKEFFELNGERIYQGFVLQTSTRYPLGPETSGTSVSPLRASLMQAAGGESLYSSLAAFSTYGEYSAVTFKAGSLHGKGVRRSGPELLLIGADHKVMACVALHETMEAQEITVPIDRCEQLMFWLAGTRGTSARYLIYDIVVTKKSLPLSIPEGLD